MRSSELSRLAVPVSVVKALHSATMSANVRRGPARSASHPQGIWAKAYPRENAPKTQPISVSETASSAAMAVLAEEMAARSIYRISESKNSAATTRNRWLLAVGMFTALGAIGTTNTDHPQILVAPRPGSAVE